MTRPGRFFVRVYRADPEGEDADSEENTDAGRTALRSQP